MILVRSGPFINRRVTVITGPASLFVGPVMTVNRLFMKATLFTTGPEHTRSVCPISIYIYSRDADANADASGPSCCDTGMTLGK